MFERSWRMLCEASRTNPALVPQSLTQKLLSQASQPPFLTWALDSDLVTAVTQQLVMSLFGFPAPAAAFDMSLSPSTIDRAAASARAAALGLPASAIGYLASRRDRVRARLREVRDELRR